MHGLSLGRPQGHPLSAEGGPVPHLLRSGNVIACFLSRKQKNNKQKRTEKKKTNKTAVNHREEGISQWFLAFIQHISQSPSLSGVTFGNGKKICKKNLVDHSLNVLCWGQSRGKKTHTTHFQAVKGKKNTHHTFPGRNANKSTKNQSPHKCCDNK